MFRLAIRILPFLAVIIGFAMALAAYMNFSGVRTAYLDLIRARMAMMAEGIANDIAAANSLGIRLTEQATLPELLRRQAATDPLTLSIDVAANDGTVVFSSDAGRVGLSDVAKADTLAFRQDRRVDNDLGDRIGIVVMRLDRAAMDREIERLGVDILDEAVPVGLGAVAAGSLISLLLLMQLHRRARRSAGEARGDDPIGRAASEMERLRVEAGA